MENTIAKLEELWLKGSTGQKDGKFPHEVAVKIDQWLFGCKKELREKQDMLATPTDPKFRDSWIPVWRKGRAEMIKEILG